MFNKDFRNSYEQIKFILVSQIQVYCSRLSKFGNIIDSRNQPEIISL